MKSIARENHDIWPARIPVRSGSALRAEEPLAELYCGQRRHAGATAGSRFPVSWIGNFCKRNVQDRTDCLSHFIAGKCRFLEISGEICLRL
jgi:hypothetical protein